MRPPTPTPEIGPAVKFDLGGQARLNLADLRGKVAVVLFYRAKPYKDSADRVIIELTQRCIDFYQKLEEAVAGKREVVLLAVRIDEATAVENANYLKARLTDPSRWVIGVDPNAAWMHVLFGGDQNINDHFVLIGPDGSMSDSGGIGGTRTTMADPTPHYELVLELPDVISKGKPTTILPADKKYPEPLKPAVMAAELRQFALALQLCAKAAGKDAAQPATELKQDLTDWATGRVKELGSTLSDAQAASDARFDAYLEMKQIADGLPLTDPGKDARKAVTEAAKDKAIIKETQAQGEYMALMAKAVTVAKAGESPDFINALKALGAKYTDTKYGKMADGDAARLSTLMPPPLPRKVG
jgi:hypothetical protein